MAQVMPRRRLLALAAGLALQACAGAALAQAPETLDDQARAAAAAGRTGDALVLMTRHLAANPGDREARMDQARYFAWTGDYAAAIEALDGFGNDDPEVRALRARVLAWAGRRREALALNTPLYEADPGDYNAAWTQAIASRIGEHPEAAVAALERSIALQPDSADTALLRRAVGLPMRATVAVPLWMYSDSDDIEVVSGGVGASVPVAPRLRALVDVAAREYSAPDDGPFAPILGGESIDERRVEVGLRYALSPYTGVQAAIGRSELGDDALDNDGATIAHLEFRHEASDSFGYTLALERDRVAFSPLSLSLGVLANTVRAEGRWEPSLRGEFVANAAWSDLTDGNRRTAVSAAYKHAVYRGERLLVNAGVLAEWEDYAEDLDNGYYSPDNYWRIAPVATAWYRLGDDSGLSVTASIGAQRDDSFDEWRRATDVSMSLIHGTESPWQIEASAAYSERLNDFGEYEGLRFGLTIAYRFCMRAGGVCF